MPTNRTVINSEALASFGEGISVGGTGAGSTALSGGNGSHTVPSGCRAVCTDTSALEPVQCSVSGTTLTITGTGSDVINWLCF